MLMNIILASVKVATSALAFRRVGDDVDELRRMKGYEQSARVRSHAAVTREKAC